MTTITTKKKQTKIAPTPKKLTIEERLKVLEDNMEMVEAVAFCADMKIDHFKYLLGEAAKDDNW